MSMSKLEQIIESPSSQNYSDEMLMKMPAPFRILADFAKQLEKKEAADAPSPAGMPAKIRM